MAAQSKLMIRIYLHQKLFATFSDGCVKFKNFVFQGNDLFLKTWQDFLKGNTTNDKKTTNTWTGFWK